MIEGAIILAAGKGSRLKPFTESVPKVMLPVANKPILEYVIESLVQSGIRKITIVVGYKKETIMDYFENGKKFNANIEYVIQEKQLGTGHALLQAKKHLTKKFLVLPGDNIIDSNLLSKIINQDKLSVLVTKSEMPSKYGVVEVENNVITALIEKPKEAIGHVISTGIYVLNKEAIEYVDGCVSKGLHKITDAIQTMIAEGHKITAIKGEGIWMDAVYPWDLLPLNETSLKNHKSTVAGTIEDGVTIKGNVFVGKDSIIRSGSYIVGPVVIGTGCEIGPHCSIFSSTAIGNNVSIGPFTEIRQSIIMDDCRIGSHSSFSNSVIGKGCRIDNNVMQIVGNSSVQIDEDFIYVKNIGSFIGDDCKIGSSTTIDSGKIIGTSCEISPMKHIQSNIKSSTHVM